MKQETTQPLSKRILSAVLGSAIAFNMAAFMPANAFAADEKNTSTVADAVYWGNSKYQRFDESLNWEQAKEYCEELGGHLVTINSQEEQDFIKESVINEGKKATYHIGLFREGYGKDWQWVTGEEVAYFNWDYGEPNFSDEHFVHMYRTINTFGAWNNTKSYVSGSMSYATANAGFICEWDSAEPAPEIKEVSPYILFSGSRSNNLAFYCWKTNIEGDVYTGANFVSHASELYVNGKIDSVQKVLPLGWKIDIAERNSEVAAEEMPDWDERIHHMAGDYEYSEDDIVLVQDKNVISGAVKTAGDVKISGTSFEGDNYIIADGDIVYNVDKFVSNGRVVLYSRNGNIIINGSDIDFNGIIYAPNGYVQFNTNEVDINGRVFADNIFFSGSVFNITGSDKDWELLGAKNVISKTYTSDADFNEGTFDGLSIDKADELTLGQRGETEFSPYSEEYSDAELSDGIIVSEELTKNAVGPASESIDVSFGLKGFGSEEIKENNVDLVIAIDESWSMEWGDRMGFAKKAAKEIISRMKPGDRCAVIGFSWTLHSVQDLTSDKELLYKAIDDITFSDGTDITLGINSTVDILENAKDADGRQKFVMLLSDGEDNTNSASAAKKAGQKGIKICALSIVNDSQQMKTVANNSNGSYLFSPSAEQIGDMMQQFADEVFDTAGKDVNVEATIPAGITFDAKKIDPAPVEVIKNEDGSTTLKWFFDKVTVKDTQKINFSAATPDDAEGMLTIAENITCTYTRRNGSSARMHADDVIIPVHTYKDSGSWSAVFDGKNEDTVWSNIFWNGMLYDDSAIRVKACAGNDEDNMSEWIEVFNHEDIEGLSGRFVKLLVEMEVSSTGKTPELFDITVLSEESDKETFVNAAPEVAVSGPDKAAVGERVFLTAEASDDAFCSSLGFNWSCDKEEAEITNGTKPFAAVTFSKPGIYTVSLTVNDNGSDSTVSKTIRVFNEDDIAVPVVELNVPKLVKAGTEVTGQIVNVNGTEITGYELTVDGKNVTPDEEGRFTFTAPDKDGSVAVTVKALNAAGLYGEAAVSVIVDKTAPEAVLKADKSEATVGDTVVITAFMSDSNGINDPVITLNGKNIEFTEGNQYKFTPAEAGKYTFVLTVTDKAGNTAESKLELTASEPVPADNDGPTIYYSLSRMILVDTETVFNFTAEDESGVAALKVKINGKDTPVVADGSCKVTPDKIGDLDLEVYAEDKEGNSNTFKATIPVVSVTLSTEKTVYAEDELITATLSYSENMTIIDQLVTVDGVKAVASGNVLSLEALGVGEHEIAWQIADECGASFAAAIKVTVVDSTSPELEVALSKADPTDEDVIEASVNASDDNGIASVTAELDGKTVKVSEDKIVLGKLTAGDHTLKVTATDNEGNYTVATVEFTVVSNNKDTKAPVLDAEAVLREDKVIEITASATDDSGKVTITGSVNGTNVTFKDGKAEFPVSEAGDYMINVRAEDEAGNFAEKNIKLSVAEDRPDFELELSVKVEKNNIKPGEKTAVTVKTNSVLGEIKLNYTADGGKIESTQNGFNFSSDRAGTYNITVTAEDQNGNKVTKKTKITVVDEEISDEDEEIIPYEKTVSVEPRARVIIPSEEKTDTLMSEEMAELADKLGTPLAVYEYLYNNLNTEYYIGARKGAIGAYEQFGGNDVDSSSVLIAMLRYLGYKAEYITGQISMTEKQVISYTGADNIETALKILMSQGRSVSRSADTYYMTRTWVRTAVGEKVYDLDVNFKKYEQTRSIADDISDQNFEELYDVNNITDFADVSIILNKYENVESEICVSRRKLIQKKITELPLKLPYICVKIDGEDHDIEKSKYVSSDYMEISFNDSPRRIRAVDLNLSSLSIVYEPNEAIYEYADHTPSDIYSLKNDYFAYSGVATISPCLYLDNVKAAEWNSALARIGDNQDMVITVHTGGNTYTETRQLLVGTLCSIVADTQNISAQALYTAYERINYSDEDRAALDKTTFFKDKYVGNFLYLIGNTYFAQLDIQNKLYAGSYDVYNERSLSYGLFTYNPAIYERFSQIELTDSGSLGLDILGNYYNSVSYNGDSEAEKRFMFASGFVSSLLESTVLEEYTGIHSVSTIEVFRVSEDAGLEYKMISEKNADIIDTLQISEKDKADIRAAVAEGNLVIVPEKNVDIGDWTGTAYIIQNQDETAFAFKLSSDLNGGYTTTDINAYFLINTIFAAVDMFQLVMGIGKLCIMLLTPPISIIGAVVAVAAVAFMAWAFEKMIDDYHETCELYFAALDGDVDAANALNAKAFVNTLLLFASPALEKAGGAAVETIGDGVSAASNSITKVFRTRQLKSLGIADDVIESVFKAPNWKSYSKDLIKAAADSGAADDVFKSLSKCSDEMLEVFNKSNAKKEIVDIIARHGDDGAVIASKCGSTAVKSFAELSDDLAERFIHAAKSQGDDFYKSLNRCFNVEDAVDFVATYGDDAAAIITKHGDDAVIAVKMSGSGATGVAAITKSGEKAITALDRVPSAECAEIIATHGDDAANIIIKHGDDAVNAFTRNSDKVKNCIKLINGSANDTIAAERTKALTRIDLKGNWESLINNVSANDKGFADNWAAAINKCSPGTEDDVYRVLNKLKPKATVIGETAATVESAQINRGLAAKKIAQYGDNAVKGLDNAHASLDAFIEEMRNLGIDTNEIDYMACVAVDTRTGKPYYGISGTTRANNLTINNGVVPDNITSYADYYRNILDDDIAASSGNVRDQLQKLSDSLNEVRKYGGEELSFEAEHSVENCAEVWAARNAILDGANFDDLAFRAEITKNCNYAFPCQNCQRTFAGHILIND